MVEVVRAVVELDSDFKRLTYLVPAGAKIGDRVEASVDMWWDGGLRAVTGKIVSFESDYRGACRNAKLIEESK